MERFNELDSIVEIENKVLENLNLLKIAKSYCEANLDKSDEVGCLSFLLDVMLKKQKALFSELVN